MPQSTAMRAAMATTVLASVAALTAITWAHAAQRDVPPVTIAVTPAIPVATPRVVLARPGQAVLFTNDTSAPLEITTAPHSAAPFALEIPAHGSAHLTLTMPGLYHYYDAATATVIDYQAETDVVHALPNAPRQSLPDQGWIVVPGPGGVPSNALIHVPANHDLLAPHVAAVLVGGSVLIHNHDTDAHNLVTDPADPTGAAFEVLGTDGEPALGGAERRITFTKPGLYHLYCSIHTRVVGVVGGWQVVVPRDDSATGYADGDPMEAWILVLQ